MRITILADNSEAAPPLLLSEHGLSLWIEEGDRRILFDAGQGPALDAMGIAASTGSACATEEPEPSHVMLAMGLAPRDAQGVVRFSVGPTTTDEEIEKAVATVTHCVERLREISTIRDSA